VRPTVTPTALGYAAILVGVPAAAAVASLWSLRRVRISPLGVSRRVTPPAPTIWRLVPFLIGLPLFVVPLIGASKNLNSNNPNVSPLIFVGLLLIMVGLVMSGSWMTMQAARALGRAARGGSSLLASRRLADSPKTAFRTVRERPFTLLRLSGTSGPTLYRVVLLESLLPLVTASLVAAATVLGVAIPFVKVLPKLKNDTGLALPGPAYYIAMALGLVFALAVISSTLPLLARVTQPNNARFE
jgi:hypothetical protein